MKFLLGLAAIGGAVVLSRRESRSSLGDFVPEGFVGDALAASERAAMSLYPVVDGLDPSIDVIYSDDNYRPQCDQFVSDASDALGAAQVAVDEGMPGAHPVKVLAVQAWSLAQAECGVEPQTWEVNAVEGGAGAP